MRFKKNNEENIEMKKLQQMIINNVWNCATGVAQLEHKKIGAEF